MKPKADTKTRTAIISTFIAFIGAGLISSTWASRIPQLKAALDMDPAAWGLVLFAMAVGSICALPVAGLIIRKIGEKLTVRFASILAGSSLAAIGLGYIGGPVPVVIALFFLGFGVGAWDIAMNVQGSAVEHRLGKAIMPKFHAGFSMGTVAGALIGAVLIAWNVSITVNLVGIGAIVAIVVAIRVAGYLSPLDVSELLDEDELAVSGVDPLVEDPFADPASTVVVDAEADEGQEDSSAQPTSGSGSPYISLGQAWREPRTLMVGLFVMFFAFAEGSAIDWIGVAMVEDFGKSAAIGTLGLATFLATMTISRWFGTNLLDRFGRVMVLRIQAVIALAGVLLFVLSGNLIAMFIGVALWGLGVSLGFPVGMSAGGDDQRNAAVRVSVVSSIGYVAFLGGPPLIGLLGQGIGVIWALMAIAAVLPIAFLLAGALRKPGKVAA